jgi:hypothetical protein
MGGYRHSAFAHAATPRYRRIAGDVRTAVGLEMVAQIEAEYARWWERGEPHPADEAADGRIARLRAAVGADVALRHGVGSGERARRGGTRP